ncbi:MAG: hypothetical protein K8R49_08480 [Candidatus Cloacimonetes bacterium]|nr:hypothetical protein [Candidatus Cloacimonadota bacterium]
MNIEFHYYITKYLALEAGFDKDEAEVIAYSSQFVDNNSICYKIETPFKSIYENYISQTMNILKPKKKLMRIYLLFHFLPGNPTSYKASRIDGKMHLLMTTPASTYSQEIFFDTTKTENLYLLGIASHMLSDTVSHQNFVGNFDEINAMKGIWETLAPNIGHADAGYKPDIPNLIWFDPRLIESNRTINNPERVLQAANKLYSNYLMFTSNSSNWSEIKKTLSNILSDTIDETQLSLYKKQRESRIKKYKKVLSEFGAEKDYDPTAWFKDAIDEDIKFLDNKKFKFDPIKDKLTFKKNYLKSDWFKFQEAVKMYQRTATIKLEPIFNQLEIREW